MTFFGLAISIGLLAFAWTHDAPWYTLAPVLLAALMLLATIVWNPVYGMRIDRQVLEIDLNGRVKQLALSRIDHIKITTWTDSADATIHLKDGTMQQIPQIARPSTKLFQEVLIDHGIAVIEG